MHDVNLPKKWNDDLAYLFGLLLGDGSLPSASSKKPNGNFQKRHLIYFFCNSKEFLNKVYIPLFKKLFGLAPRIKLIKNKKNPLYNCRIESKMIYEFLEKKGFTVGRKAKIAKIPKLPKKYHLSLLAGLLDTDGGKKGNGFGLSTASKYLAIFCEKIFKNLGFSYNSCPWFYKDHIYHQVYTHKRNFSKFLKKINLKNKDKVRYIKENIAQVA